VSMNRDELFNDPDYLAWEQDVLESLVPKLETSEIVATIYTGGHDVKLAVELGFAVLMDKPIIILAQEGVVVPETLTRIARVIVIIDLHNESGREIAARTVAGVVSEIFREEQHGHGNS